MTKLNITWIGEAKAVTTKYGQKQKNSIKAAEYGDKFISFWVSPSTAGWKVGAEVDVQEVTSREYQGKTYYDVVMPKVDNRPQQAPEALTASISEILTKLGAMNFKITQIHDHLSGKSKFNTTSAGTKVPDFSEVDDIRPEDIPFN